MLQVTYRSLPNDFISQTVLGPNLPNAQKYQPRGPLVERCITTKCHLRINGLVVTTLDVFLNLIREARQRGSSEAEGRDWSHGTRRRQRGDNIGVSNVPSISPVGKRMWHHLRSSISVTSDVHWILSRFRNQGCKKAINSLLGAFLYRSGFT